MQWGCDHEDVAVARYEKLSKVQTFACGLVIDPAYCWLGASPDRLVEEDGTRGVVEVKCPSSTRHLSVAEYASLKGSYVVWTPSSIEVERIEFNRELWPHVVHNLTDFFSVCCR